MHCEDIKVKHEAFADAYFTNQHALFTHVHSLFNQSQKNTIQNNIILEEAKQATYCLLRGEKVLKYTTQINSCEYCIQGNSYPSSI